MILLNELNKFTDIPFYRPNGGNFGDMLISNAEYEYFNDNNIKYRDIKLFNENKDFSLIHGGGGGFVSYWSYKQRIPIYFNNKHLKKCIILPSSFYNCDDFLSIIDSRFIIFCRDKKSYDYCRSKNNTAKFILYDDMAFKVNIKNLIYNNSLYSSDKQINLFNQAFLEYKKNNNKHAFFIRNDKERIDIPNINQNKIFDLSSFLYMKGEDITYKLSKYYSQCFVNAINQFDVISTNRLHIMICAYLLNKKIELYDNSYNKISEVYNFSILNKNIKCDNIKIMFN